MPHQCFLIRAHLLPQSNCSLDWETLVSLLLKTLLYCVSLDLLYKNATVSVQDNMADLPILFAEKALMIANQISKKLPISSVENPD